MATLLDLQTEHPGGWADILQALENHAGEQLTVEKPQGRAVVIVQVEVDSVRQKLGALTAGIVGVLAAGAQAELAKANLPVPGDLRWLEPAESWFTNRKKR